MNKFQTQVFKTQNKGSYVLSDYMNAEKRHLTRQVWFWGSMVFIAVGLFVVASFDSQSIQAAVELGAK